MSQKKVQKPRYFRYTDIYQAKKWVFLFLHIYGGGILVPISPFYPQDAIELAKTLPGPFATDANLECREIGDGNLNLVFHITDQNSDKSIIIKQALPYAKVVGESWPLSLVRARIEREILQEEYRLCPGMVPEVYHYDDDLALTVMEDLSDHVIMRKGLIDGGTYPLFAQHIGEFMARTLFFTSDLGMNQQLKKRNRADSSIPINVK